jgi:7-carboxy-7-deazaguanine synthase
MSIELSETYISIAGEAPIAGEPVFIVRCAGCNLDCSYCDSRFARTSERSVMKEELALEIARTYNSYPGIKVLFTGGEPLLGERQGELMSIVRSLPNIGFYVETNGSIPIEDLAIPNCSFVADMKTPSSGFADSFIDENLPRLRPDLDCIKIVLDESDFSWVKEKVELIREQNPRLPVYLSAEWERMSLLSLSEFILSNNLPVRISIQLHKMIWGRDTRRV